MSKYTTGEIAKLCDVTVRTVQYYDTRGILVPSELSEGGRRLYSDEDMQRLKTICFLRDLGLSIDTVSQVLKDDNSGEVVSILLLQQEKLLKEEIGDKNEKLDKIEVLRREIGNIKSFSPKSIGDIAYIMSDRKKLTKLHRNLILTGLPLSIFQWVAIILWIVKGFWWLFLIWAVTAIPYAVIASRYYFKNVAYLCPECHQVFKPTFREAFFARHTPSTRKLTCTACGHNGFCVEVAAGQ